VLLHSFKLSKTSLWIWLAEMGSAAYLSTMQVAREIISKVA